MKLERTAVPIENNQFLKLIRELREIATGDECSGPNGHFRTPLVEHVEQLDAADLYLTHYIGSKLFLVVSQN